MKATLEERDDDGNEGGDGGDDDDDDDDDDGDDDGDGDDAAAPRRNGGAAARRAFAAALGEAAAAPGLGADARATLREALTFTAALVPAGWARPCAAPGCARRDGVDGVALKACSGCKTSRYCSAACQRADWRAHKRLCGILSPATVRSEALATSTFAAHGPRWLAEAQRRGWAAHELVVVLDFTEGTAAAGAPLDEELVRADRFVSARPLAASGALPRVLRELPERSRAQMQALVASRWTHWRGEYGAALWLTLFVVSPGRDEQQGGDQLERAIDVRSVCVRDDREAEQVRARARALAVMPVEGALPAHALEHLQLAAARFFLREPAGREAAAERLLDEWALDMRVPTLAPALARLWLARVVEAGLERGLACAFRDLQARVERGELRAPIL